MQAAEHEIGSMFVRMENVITFMIVRFVYETLHIGLSNANIVFSCMIIVVPCSIAPSTLKEFMDKPLYVIVDLIRKLGIMCGSQALINMLALDHSSQQMSFGVLLNSVLALTSLLVLLTVIPENWRSTDYVSRSVWLLLYMYADTIHKLLFIEENNIVLILLCIFIVALFTKYERQLEQIPGSGYVVQAIQMLIINVFIDGISNTRLNAIDTQAAIIVIFVEVLDTFSYRSPILANSRDYAVWKSTQLLFELYNAYSSGILISVAILIVLLLVKTAKTSLHTVLDLAILVMVKALLDAMSEQLSFTQSYDRALLLFMYVIFLHILIVGVTGRS